MDSLTRHLRSPVTLCAAGGLLLIAVIWQFLPSGPSRRALRDAALHADDPAARQMAALQFIELEVSQDELHELFSASTDPAVRAICVQGMGDADDQAAVETLFAAMEDDSPLVSASAAGSLGRLMRCRIDFPTDGNDALRSAAIAQARQRWDTLIRYELLDELAAASSLAYFYDQHTGEVFAAPAQLPDVFDLPAGPYQGMPAAVRAEVFAPGGCGEASRHFVGWLTAGDQLLKEHGVALPAPPGEEVESTMLKRPDAESWVYAASPEGIALQESVYNSQPASASFARPCRPGE
jgi:hypothetical protein